MKSPFSDWFWGDEEAIALPSQADLDAVAEEERVRLATAGGQLANAAMKLAASGESPLEQLIDAAMQLAVRRIYLDPNTTAPDHLTTAFCSECTAKAEAFDRLQHAPECLVWKIFATVILVQAGQEIAQEAAAELGAGRQERHVELFPVEHPTATELA